MTAGGTLPPLAGKLLPFLRKCAEGEYGIALGGAHAKGIEDEQSDLDLYVFARSIPGNDERSRMAREFDPGIGGILSWGDESSFVQAGTDFQYGLTRVEIWFRESGFIEGIIGDCEEGRIKQEFTVWNPMGFYNYCALSDLYAMKPLDDPAGLLGRWKGRVERYPPKLRAEIISTFLVAAGFWPGNFHYASAVERRDVVYCTGIAQQVVHHLVQVLFAVNRTYFPGDKKLAGALGRLKMRPQGLVERVEEILLPGRAATVEDFRRQRTMLQELFDDVKRLAAEDGK